MVSTPLAVQSLDKQFRDETVLEDVEFELEEGEFCILLGPSGCGKSTLLRCIAGLYTFQQGEVVLRGETTNDVPIEERDLGYVFQEFEETLFPHMTVEENVAFGLEERDEEFTQSEIDEQINEVLELLSISHTKKSEPGSLSGGQQQRVELARQLAREQDIMLLDDPLGDLDYKLQKYMEIELRRYQRDTNSTFLYTTHDQDQALKLADKIIIMNEGQIEQIGTPEEVYNSPANAFVHRFIGNTNSIGGTVEEVNSSILTARTGIGKISAEYIGSEPLAGDEITIVVRPEEIKVGNDAEGLDNTRKGTITGLTFTGEETELSIELAGTSQRLRVEVPESLSDNKIGKTIQVGWDASQAVAYGKDDVSVVDSKSLNSIQSFN